jgi:hypothetical protein
MAINDGIAGLGETAIQQKGEPNAKACRPLDGKRARNRKTRGSVSC